MRFALIEELVGSVLPLVYRTRFNNQDHEIADRIQVKILDVSRETFGKKLER